MSTTLQVEIVTPEARAFSGPASEVLLPAWEGEMGIYPQHDAVLTLLRAGRCVVTDADGVHQWVVGRGFAEVGPDRVTILTDSCEISSGIDKAQAASDAAAAEQVLATADVSSERWRQAKIAAEHAHARMQA
ncbi:MAG TPA: ATP synthase F1 subunit epsilon [Deltaproteobacteria bacterium]|nr:ATP synthase F1 subunit epsilon [Deltaproteobacteria bacterium]